MRLRRSFDFSLPLAAASVIFGLTGLATDAQAQSRSSVTVNGKQIEVTGGSRSSVASANGVVTMTIDDRRMTIADDTLTVDGRSVPLGDFSRVEIFVEPDGVRAISDGRVVLDPLPDTTEGLLPGSPPDGSDEQVDLAVRLFQGDAVPRDIPRSVALMTRAAEAGNPQAQRNLGLLYRDGSGVNPDRAAAMMWLERAALGGDGIAQDELGEMARSGRAETSDLAESFARYQREAEAGNATAMNNLGYAYEQGLGTPQDQGEALRWYRRSAEQGDRAGQFNYGLMRVASPVTASDAVEWLRKSVEQDYAPAFNALGYAYDNGFGVQRDPVEAARLYRVAAERGLRAAQFNLGLSYEQGAGVGRDRAKALQWLQAAADQGHPEAATTLQRLRSTTQ